MKQACRRVKTDRDDLAGHDREAAGCAGRARGQEPASRAELDGPGEGHGLARGGRAESGPPWITRLTPDVMDAEARPPPNRVLAVVPARANRHRGRLIGRTVGSFPARPGVAGTEQPKWGLR